LFDLGGVVCEFDPSRRLARLSALSGLPETEVHARIWQSGLAAEFDRGRYTSREWHHLVSERLDLTCEFDLMEEVFLSALRVNEAVVALLDDLDRHLRVALFTDNPTLLRDAIPRRFPALHSRFAPTIFSCELGLVKSDRGAFERALERLNAPPHEVLYIDDVPANVEAAHDVGMLGYHFTRPRTSGIASPATGC
jgi:glucose-1-phosphatase